VLAAHWANPALPAEDFLIDPTATGSAQAIFPVTVTDTGKLGIIVR